MAKHAKGGEREEPSKIEQEKAGSESFLLQSKKIGSISRAYLGGPALFPTHCQQREQSSELLNPGANAIS